jgi:Domain of unknown function (DUF929)
VLTLIGSGAIMAVSPAGASAGSPTPASAAILRDISSIPLTEFNAIGPGSIVAPTHITNQPALIANKLPEVLYVGAEFCPYCGVTRWPLAIALSRFGTFSGLQTTYSAANDTAGPNTPTLDFRNASYKSDYIDFTGIEYEDGAGKVIGTLTTEQNSLFNNLGGGNFPFIDFGGKWAQSGASYPTATLAGLTPEAVAGQLVDSSSKIGSTIQAAADVFTAAICEMDGGKPASVCNAAGVTTTTTALASLATAK